MQGATFNTLSSAVAVYGTGASVNFQNGSTGAYYEQGGVRVLIDANGQYQIQIITNEPLVNPQTGQRSYNLVLTATSQAALEQALKDAIKANPSMGDQTKEILGNASSDLTVFGQQHAA